MRRLSTYVGQKTCARSWLGQIVALILALAALALVQVPLAADTIAEAITPPPPSELVQFRTLSSRTFDNHDGTYTTSAYSGRIHYRDDAGVLRPISSQLVASQEPGYAYENEANSFRAFFKSQLDSNYLQLALGPDAFLLSLQDAAQSQAQTRARGISYPDVLPGADLRYELQPDGLKETLFLQNAQAPLSYRFLLNPPPGARIHAVQRDDGSWAFYLARHARPVFVLDAPWASEADEPDARRRHAALAVSRQGADFVLDLTLDGNWLHDPARQFPVRVDPTITIQPPFQDASFDFACPGCAGVTSDRLSIGTVAGADSNPIWRSALQFSLADIPDGASISSAKLKLYFDGTCLPAGTPCGGTSHQIDALRMANSWSPSAKSSSLAFDTTPLTSFTLPNGASAQWMNWDITSTVQNWYSGAQSNFGLLLKRSTEPLASSGPKPPSRNYAAEPTLGPKLEVTYNGDGGQLLEPETVHSNGAELHWIPYSGPGAPPFDSYEVHRSTNPNFTPSESTQLTKIVGDPAVTSFRDTTAKPGATFTYKVVVNGYQTNRQTVTMPADGLAQKLLHPDSKSGLDTYISERSDSTDCVNRGAVDSLKVGTDAISIWRSLLRFDLSDIAPDATLSNATLSLWHPTTTSTALTVRAHQLTGAWEEGSGIAACTGDGATWYESDGGIRWGQNGGDYDGTAAASLSIPSGAQPSWSQLTLTSLAQQWVDGTEPNDGVLLKLDDEARVAGKSVDFYSSDFAVAPTLRPKLSVTYADGSHAIAPTVTVSKPVAGALVKGNTVQIEAAALDDRRVDLVEFFADGSLIGSDSSAPFSATWNSTTEGNGSHGLTARATDDAGNQTTSAAVSVTVGNSAPPTTAITSPAGGSIVTGTVTVNASAADDVAVTKVEFYADGLLFATDTAAPYSATWNTLDPALPAYDGAHTLTTKAYDGHAQVTTSTAVSVTAANASGTRFLADYSSTPIPSTFTFQPGIQTQATTPIDVTVKNRSAVTWSDSTIFLRYRWFRLGSSTSIVDSANTSLGAPVLPNGQVTRQLLIAPPDVPPGVGRANYRLRIDLYDQGTGSWFAGQGTKPLEQTLTIEQLNPAHPPTPPLEPLSAPEQFGVEPMFQYDHEQLGLGMENLVNVASGNSVVRWRPLQAPGKGLASVVQLTYNSLEGRCNANFCPIGSGWSLSVSSLTRFGQQALKVTGNRAELVDADGTLHLFDWDNQASKWIPRPGTHLYLRDDGAHPAGYLVTTPNRVTYAYDCGGNPTSVTDKNGNELTFVLDSPPNGCSSQRVVDVKDAANRAFHIDYYEGTPENKRVRSITDHDGRRLEFCYDPQGGDHPNLLQVIEHTAADTSNCDAPAAASRSFTFTYEPDGSQQNRQLQTVTDPAGHATAFDYWPSGDPREDKLSARTDRENAQTAFDYAMQADPGSNTTTVTAPPTDASRVTVYTDAHDAASTDGNQDQGLIDSILDPEQRTTTIAWTNTGQSGQPLRHVWKVTEPQSRTTELTYNTRGLVTDRYDPMGHHWHFDYLDVPADGGFTTDLTSVKDPNAFSQSGNPWTFVYDASNINLLKVIDPDGSQAEPFMTYSYYTGAPGYPGAIHSALDGNGNGPTVEAYDHNGLPTQVRDAEQGVSQASYDPSGLLQWSQDPLHYGDDPSGYGRDIRTVFDYDGFGRPIAMSEPKSTRYQRGELIWRSLVYDANDNVLVSRHPAYGRPASPGAAVTTMSYDHMDRLLTSTSAESHETAFTYDGAGRLTSVRRPKGFVNPPPPALSYVTAFHYDRLDRVLSRVQYGADGVDNRRTYFCYSNAGDLRWVTAPKAGLTDAPSPCETDTGVPRYTTRYAYNAAHRVTSITEPLHTQSPANETRTRTFDYDANGNTTSVTAEIDDQTNSVTNYTYTRRNEPELTSQLYTSGPRYVTSKLVYDRAGNVIRSVSPRAWDAAGGQDPGAGGDYVTEYRYDALNRLERIALPKKTGGDPRTYIHRRYDPNGNLRWTTLPVEVAEVSDPPQELTADQWSEYKYFDPGWISTSNDHVKPEVHYDYTAEGFQQQRNLCGNEGCDERTWSYNRDGLLSFLTEHSWRGSGTASYSYDENDNLTTAVEARGITKPSETAYTIESLYNGYDEPTQTRQKQETDSDYRYTNFHYDPNGNPAQRWDDGNSPEAGRSHEFAYDESDQLTSDYDYGPDKARNTADDQQTAYDYWLTGWDREKAITRPLATGSPTEAKTDWTYFLNGDLKTLQTRNRNDTLVEHHTLDYVDGAVYMNGNQVSDTFGLQTAAASACDDTDCRAKYSYGPRDELQQEQDYRPDPTLTRTLSWTYDPALNIKTETTDSTTRRFVYTGTRLSEEQNAAGQTQSRYFYDPAGNLDCVTTGAPSSGNDCADPYGAQVPTNLVARYHYDYLDRLDSYRTYGPTPSKTDYELDPLNRLVNETQTQGQTTKKTCFTYLGLTLAASTERRVATSCGGAATSTKSYAFDADLERTSMTVSGLGAGDDGDYFFARNVHGDPSLLLDTNGQSKGSYSYLPYGSADPALTHENAQDTSEPFNPYRFNDRRLDAASGSLDMGARRFSSNIGGGHYLQADFYVGAEPDLALSLDPINMNRYAFGPGNPLTYAETNGHSVIAGATGSGTSNGARNPRPCFSSLCLLSRTSRGGSQPRQYVMTDEEQVRANLGSVNELHRRELDWTRRTAQTPDNARWCVAAPECGTHAVTADEFLETQEQATDVFVGKSAGNLLFHGHAGDTVGAALEIASLFVRRISVSRAGAELAHAGVGAEESVSTSIGVARNVGRERATIPGSGSGGFRVPDFDPAQTIATRGSIVEVKDVRRLSSSPQLRDLVAYAESRNVPLEIFTNAPVPTRGEIPRWIARGRVVIQPLP